LPPRVPKFTVYLTLTICFLYTCIKWKVSILADMSMNHICRHLSNMKLLCVLKFGILFVFQSFTNKIAIIFWRACCVYIS